MQLKFITLLIGFFLVSCSNGQPFRSDLVKEVKEEIGGETFLFRAFSWGVSGNHEQVTIKNIELPQDSLVFNTNTIYYKFVGHDSLVVVGGEVKSRGEISRRIKVEVIKDYNYGKYDSDSTFKKFSYYDND